MPAPKYDTLKECFENQALDGGDNCWIFLQTDTVTGYGKFAFKGKRYYAHRVSYELYKGPIPTGQRVLHKCDNPPCCNPDHLFLGDQQDNVQDMIAKGRDGVTGIRNGHAILNDDLVRTIREELTKGIYQQVLADRYGVIRQTISNIKRQITWSHVK